MKHSPRTTRRLSTAAAIVLSLSISTITPAFAVDEAPEPSITQPSAAPQPATGNSDSENPEPPSDSGLSTEAPENADTDTSVAENPIDNGAFDIDLETGVKSLSEPRTNQNVRATPYGYSVADGYRYNNGDYVVRVISSPRVEELRPALIAAINNINQTGAANITLADGQISARPANGVRGEIYFSVNDSIDCGSQRWVGCAFRTYNFEDGVKKAYLADVYINSKAFQESQNYKQHTIAHELGHALGLDHYVESYGGNLQLMYPIVFEYPLLGAGDTAGLVQLKHPKPVGNFELATGGDKKLTVKGWAMDGLHNNAINVHVYVDGAYRAAVPANVNRPDVNTAYQRGPNHGFFSDLSASSGVHNVCVYAKHNQTTMSTSLGCKQVTVTDSNVLPTGNLESVTGVGEIVRYKGWALDRNTTNSIGVHIYLDGGFVGAITANQSRPDVDRIHGMGPNHGFSGTFRAAPGLHTLCAYAINFPAGTNPSVGCQSVNVTANKPPFGNLESVTASSSAVTVKGWVIDPDTTEPIDVHIYVDGKANRAITANVSRPDVNSAYKMGANHGFNQTVGVAPGARTICIYAINAPSGTNPSMGCQVVNVPK